MDEDDLYFYGYEPEEEEEAEEEGMAEPEVVELWAEDDPKMQGSNERGPMEHTTKFTRILAELDDAEIARRMTEIINIMAEEFKVDISTFLYYLSWNLKIPSDMVRKQYVIRPSIYLCFHPSPSNLR